MLYAQIHRRATTNIARLLHVYHVLLVAVLSVGRIHTCNGTSIRFFIKLLQISFVLYYINPDQKLYVNFHACDLLM
jgi:hypothetical protein